MTDMSPEVSLDLNICFILFIYLEKLSVTNHTNLINKDKFYVCILEAKMFLQHQPTIAAYLLDTEILAGRIMNA
jgi:hypothetical protein